MNFHTQIDNGAKPRRPKLRRRDAGTYIREHAGLVGSASLLAKLAVFGGGPRFYRFGSRVVLYDPDDLDEWIAEKLGKPIISKSED